MYARCQWAGRRETTREEDMAYCLLGLFSVNMPLLYGEGGRAFERLQEEMMKTTTDTTLFLWQGKATEHNGMLASGPSCFVAILEKGNLFSDRSHDHSKNTYFEGWTVTNAGIRMNARMMPYALTQYEEEIYLLLISGSAVKETVIFLRRRSGFDQMYDRVTIDGKCWELIESIEQSDRSLWMHTFEDGRTTAQRIFSRSPLIDIAAGPHSRLEVSMDLTYPCSLVAREPFGPRILLQDVPFPTWKLVDTTSGHDGLQMGCTFSVPFKYPAGLVGHLVVSNYTPVDLLICLGFDERFRLICVMVPFCAGMYGGHNTAVGLGEWDIFRSYRKLLSQDKHKGFDQRSRVTMGRSPKPVGLSGWMWCCEMEWGKLHARRVNAQGHKATISLDGEAFLRAHGIDPYLTSSEISERVKTVEADLAKAQQLLFEHDI
jgi:hypothetical protein